MARQIGQAPHWCIQTIGFEKRCRAKCTSVRRYSSSLQVQKTWLHDDYWDVLLRMLLPKRDAERRQTFNVSIAAYQMKCEHIVALANQAVDVEFRAMERSLRATGCDAPLRVIPYSEELFDLPANAAWWHTPVKWMKQHFGGVLRHPFQYRYYLLSCGGFQVADSDIIFLRDPAEVLAPHRGLVASCHQWHVPHFVGPSATIEALQQMSPTWQARLFNAGQFALESPVYSEAQLLAALKDRETSRHVFINESPWDQGGLNYIVAKERVPIVNLTFPPYNMASTWAGDYPGDYEGYWSDDNRPYLIHWAGPTLDEPRPINELFLNFLTRDEVVQWKEKQQIRFAKQRDAYRRSLGTLRRLVHDTKQLIKKSSPALAENLKRYSASTGVK